jgi:IS605 OrfB family transposase
VRVHLVEKIRLFPDGEQEDQLRELAAFCCDAANFISEYIYTHRLRSKGVGTLYKPDWETRTTKDDPDKVSLYIVLCGAFDFSGKKNLANAIIQRVKSSYKSTYVRNIKQGDAFYRAGKAKYRQLKKGGMKGETLKAAAKLTQEEKKEIAERYGMTKPLSFNPFIPTLKQNTKWGDATVSFWGVTDIPFASRLEDIEPRDAIAKLNKNNKWLLHLPVETSEEEVYEPAGWLGVDVGLANLAVTSEGTVYYGGENRRRGETWFKQRQRMQKKGTKSARRRLKALSEKETRWRKNLCHEISTAIVRRAKELRYGVAVEMLKNIRRNMRQSRKLNRQLHGSFPFGMLLSMLEYKAEKEGVPFLKVDPKNTSRTCPECEYVAEENRISRTHFNCVECGYTNYADHVAATNISRIAETGI